MELCLAGHSLHLVKKPISILNILIRLSTPGLYTEGVKEIRRVYCAGADEICLFKNHTQFR